MRVISSVETSWTMQTFEVLQPQLQAVFPNLSEVTLWEFAKAINKESDLSSAPMFDEARTNLYGQ